MSLPNNVLFHETRTQGISWCERGISQHIDLLDGSDRVG